MEGDEESAADDPIEALLFALSSGRMAEALDLSDRVTLPQALRWLVRMAEATRGG